MLSDNPDKSTILNLSKAAEIIGQLGEELAFVAPDQDAGLLPINKFVMDLEELADRDAPASVTAGLKVARVWLDQILDGPGKFTEESIRNLNGWHAWMSSVLLASEGGTPMPAWPEGWGGNHRAVTRTEGAKSAATSAPSGEEEPSIRLNLAEDLEFLREFHGESVELLHNIEQGVLVLEDNPADAVTINSIFRAFHTFKGGAGFLHLEALRDLAHDLESLLDAVRRSELRITSEIIDLILAGADTLKHFTHEIGGQLQGANPGAPILVPTLRIIGRVQSALRGEAPPAAAPAGVAGPAEASEAAGASSAPTVESATPSPSSGFVKLDTPKLDSLVDMVGELVIAQSMVVQDPDVQQITASNWCAACASSAGSPRNCNAPPCHCAWSRFARCFTR